MTGYRWHGDEIKRQLEAEIRRRLMAAAIVVQGHAKQLISGEGAGVWLGKGKGSVGRGAKAVGWKGKHGLVLKSSKGLVAQHRTSKRQNLAYGAFPSKPGEPPHAQTGRLRGSVAWEMASRFVARVGSNSKYAKYLELGTSRMAARPWLRRALSEMGDKIRRLLSAPISLR